VNFSPEWDEKFRAGTHLSLWPWSDLVSYVSRYAKPSDGYHRVLEIGCGVGANIPFFLGSGADYCAIEGSPSAVNRIHVRNPELRDKVVVGDFTNDIPFPGPFDLVVDRSAITHNSTEDIKRALILIVDRVRPGGKLIGIDWFSDVHQDAVGGEALDTHTRTRIPSGHLSGLGACHFSDKTHLTSLLTTTGFQVERLEHKLNEVAFPASGGRPAWWNFVAVRS